MKEKVYVRVSGWDEFKAWVLKWTAILGGGGAGIALMTYMSNR